jgi:hypothetical protein
MHRDGPFFPIVQSIDSEFQQPRGLEQSNNSEDSKKARHNAASSNSDESEKLDPMQGYELKKQSAD